MASAPSVPPAPPAEAQAGPPAPVPPPQPAPAAAPVPPPPHDYLAAGLSYLIPGLGQVYQGRVGKGLLFFVGLYGLFFYGMGMGQWKNVWLPDATDLPDVQLLGYRLGGAAKAVSYRPQFAGQFWIGAAAWPAAVQYRNFDKTKTEGPVFGSFERAPTEEELNALQRDGNKRWDLGWVYTVIAGVLNLLVIYDAFAGPMIREDGSIITDRGQGVGESALRSRFRRARLSLGRLIGLVVSVVLALLVVWWRLWGRRGVRIDWERVIDFAFFSIYRELPVLLVVVSLVYAATRHDRWDKIVREAAGWGTRIALFLFAIGAGLYLLSTYL